MDSTDQKKVVKVWNLSLEIKDKFPNLNTSQDVKDFAATYILTYIHEVMTTKELENHLIG